MPSLPFLRLTVRYLRSTALALLALAVPATAQTAHLVGSQMTLVSTGLASPSGLALDSSGNLYIADTANNRVIKETPGNNSYVETIVDSGLSAPAAVAVDTSGNVYIADTGNNRVLKETLSAGSYTQSIVASGFSAPAGVAVDSSGNIFVSDTGNNTIWRETLSSGTYTQTPVSSAGLNGPRGIAVDGSGNIYVADTLNHGLKLEKPSGATYVQQSYSVGTPSPVAVAADSSGTLYVADSQSNHLLKVASGSLSILSTAGLNTPSGIALDAKGNLFVSDAGNNRVVEEMSLVTNFKSVSIGGRATASLIFSVNNIPLAAVKVLTQGAPGLDFQDAGTGTCTTNGPSYVYSLGEQCTVDLVFSPRMAGLRSGAVVLQNAQGTKLTDAYLRGVGFGPQSAFLPGLVTSLPITVSTPTAVAVDGSGNIYVQNAIAAYNPNNSIIKASWNGNGYTVTTVRSGLPYPEGIAVDGAGNVIIFDESGVAYKETPNATGYTESVVGSVSTTPTGMGVDANGNIYLATVTGVYKATLTQSSSGNDTYSVALIDSQTHAVSQIVVDANDVVSYAGAVDANGNLYYPSNNSVLRSNGSGTITVFSIGSGNTGRLAMDSYGNIYVTSYNGNTVSKYNVSDPPTLLFNSTALNTTSSDSPKTITLQNIGNAPLTFPIPLSGNNPAISANFSLSSSGGTACPLVGSTAFSPGTLAANSSCTLPVSYSPTASTPLGGILTLTDDSLNATAPNYTTQTIALGVKGAASAAPVLAWSAPASIVYGTALSGAQLNASSSVPGTFTYTPAAGTVLGVGTQTLSVTFTPTDTADYATATATTSVTVTKATPVITWATPSAIIYGASLSATQLNATAPTPGTFTYTPTLGTVLGAGSQTLSVTFTPTDTANYTSATASVTLTVNKATPSVAWNTPAPITYGTALDATQLNATASVDGSFAYTPASGAVLNAGSQLLSVIFTPTDTANYTTASANVSIQISKVTPTITWTNPAAITYGTRLSSTQLNASASVPGSFVYNPASGTNLSAGPHTLNVTFTPTDRFNYNNATGSVTLTVNKATPTITWSNPSAITYGAALSSTQLNATASVPGTLTYTPALGAVLNAGPQTLSVSFTPTDTSDYAAATATATVTVNKADPVITWSPAALTYGSILGSAQLNATASVDGSFTYSPNAGTTFPAGSTTLAAAFTPTDTTNYNSAAPTATLIVNKAPLTLTAANTARVFGASNPTFTGTISGAVNGDSLTESFSTSATSASIVGSYSIVPSASGANIANYSINATNGTLTITQAGTATTFALSNNNLTFTANVSSLTTGTPTGTVTFYEGQNAVGTATLSGNTASYTVSSFPTGNVTLSAQYSGDANFTQSAAPPILELAVAPQSSSLTVARSGAATNSLGITVPSGYIGSVQFSCTGLPQYASCSFSPSSINFTGSTSTGSVNVTITTGVSASLTAPALPPNSSRLPLLALLVAPGLLGLSMARRRLRLNPNLHRLLLLLLLAGISTVLTACGGAGGSITGGGSANNQTPTGSSSVQVVASGSGGLSQTASFTLSVQ